MAERVLVSWSSGKDGAWSLHVLREDPRWEPVGLLTTVIESSGRVATHGVRRELVAAQARSVGLPLQVVELPPKCPNSVYEARLLPVWKRARTAGIAAVAFGDLFLADIRAYRTRQLADTGLLPLFPLWNEPTRELAERMIAGGLSARVTCVDTRRLDPTFLGRPFDRRFLADLPQDVDRCAENGEFHTFVTAGPGFARPLAVQAGARSERDGFATLDLRPAQNG